MDFYGVTAEITLPSWLREELSKDLSYFEKQAEPLVPMITLAIHEIEPPYGSVPRAKASLYQPDSVSYDYEGKRYVDYFGKALSVYDYGSEKGELFSLDRNLLHELSYLMLLSRTGELLDKKGVHRVHSCGFVFKGKGVICLMPQGGGKTTLYLELLKNNDVQLISDDTPLISANGMVLPFPLRIGVSEGVKIDIPQQYLGSLERRKYGKKVLIDAKYFSDRISPPVKIKYLFRCEREFSKFPRIIKSGRTTVFFALFRDCVAGLGLPQMVEYFLRYSPRDILSKSFIAASRMITCVSAVFKSEVYTFIIGTDTAQNAGVLIEFLASGKR